MTCHRCKFSAGVKNGKTKCLKKKREVDRTGDAACNDFDGSEMPGKVLTIQEFNKRIKQAQ